MENFTVSDAIRYLLIGFLGFFGYAYVCPDDAKKLATAFGGIPLSGCALAGGAIFFFIYEALVLRYIIHPLKDRIGAASPVSNYRVLLKQKFPEYRLTSLEAEDFYVAVLRNKLGWKDVPDLGVLTSGIHLLYMSGLVAGGFASYASIASIPRPTWPLWLLAGLALTAGVLLDRRAEKMETALLYGGEDAAVRTALAHAFPDRTKVSSDPQLQAIGEPTGATLKEAALAYLRTAPLPQVEQHLRLLAERINEHRRENSGLTPRELFVPCIELGLTYACVELLLYICDADGVIEGVALKKRDATDQGWQGKLTICGAAVRPFDTLRAAQEHVLDEVASDGELRSQIGSAFDGTVYIEVHREDTDTTVEGRRSNCLTAVYSQSIAAPTVAQLSPGFEIVPLRDLYSASIVDHHRQTISALLKLRVLSGAA